jgi:RNA polymerase sigma-70 factor (ECF subfamily)
MTGNNDFRLLVERMLTGDPHATKKFWDEYRPALLHAVRRRLSKQLRSKYDSLDFEQDVWKSFFSNLPAAALLQSPSDLVAHLTRVAQNKVADAIRRQLGTQKRNLNREQALDTQGPGATELAAASQPTPSEVVSRGEQWDKLLENQPKVYRRVLVLAREGKDVSEIASELQIHRRTVRRIIARSLLRLQQ